MSTSALSEILARLADAGAVRPLVIQSWRRSHAAGVDPDAPAFRRVSGDELERRQAANRVLLAIAVPHLRWLSRWFRERPHVAYLTDRDGIVLHAEGNRAAIERYSLTPGHDWSEAAMGTNGAGTALASGQPVAVIGCDHWSSAWKDAACLGAPVLDACGRIVGAIDISLDVQDGDADRLVVVAHVAYTISQELARSEAEDRHRAAEELHQTLQAALDAERRARAASDEAVARAEAIEAELRLSERRLHTIIDSTPAIVYVVDAAARFRLINRRFAELFSLEPGAVIGRPLSEYFPPEAAAQFAANNRQVLESGEVCEFEEVVSHGGEVRTYISVKAPLYDAAGTAYGVCGVSTDITERKRLVSALELAHRQKDAFVTTVAHELRQPLGAIQAAVALMQKRVGRTAGERARAVVERQVQQLTRLVEDLLEASRLSQGKLTLQRRRTALHEILEAAVTIVQPMAEERQQQLAVDLPAGTIWLDADPARLQQVFSNLLTNAAKFTPRSGRISLTVDASMDAVAVRVRDTGRGMSPDIIPHVFDLFTQAAPESGGVGVGLAIVRALVERHGGTVAARSDGPGTGSEFIVTLPRVGPPSA